LKAITRKGDDYDEFVGTTIEEETRTFHISLDSEHYWIEVSSEGLPLDGDIPLIVKRARYITDTQLALATPYIPSDETRDIILDSRKGYDFSTWMGWAQKTTQEVQNTYIDEGMKYATIHGQCPHCGVYQDHLVNPQADEGDTMCFHCRTPLIIMNKPWGCPLRIAICKQDAVKLQSVEDEGKRLAHYIRTGEGRDPNKEDTYGDY